MNKPESKNQKPQSNFSKSSENKDKNDDITAKIIEAINKSDSFGNYKIRDLVKDAEEFGPYLKNEKLETNQVRKFLDAINRIKTKLAETGQDFSKIEAEVVLLKPKLAYAASRQKAAKPLSKVMGIAIDKVRNTEDFQRLVQFLEAIIAYHKAAGGK